MRPAVGAALAALLLGCGPGGPAGPSASGSSAIVGGAPTVDFEAVGMVLQDGSFLCSAVLITPRRVATAAHCVYGFETDPAQLSVALAPGTDLPPLSSAIPVSQIYLEPRYTTLPSRDLAVLELSSDAAVVPMARRSTALGAEDDGAALTLVGFGLTARDDDGADRRRRSVTTPLDELTDLQVRWRTAGEGICEGDSGGAVLMDGGAGPELVALALEGDTNCVDWGAGLRLDRFEGFLADPAAGDDDDTGSVFDDDDTGAAEAGCEDCSGGQTIAWLPLLLLPVLRRRP